MNFFETSPNSPLFRNWIYLENSQTTLEYIPLPLTFARHELNIIELQASETISWQVLLHIQMFIFPIPTSIFIISTSDTNFTYYFTSHQRILCPDIIPDSYLNHSQNFLIFKKGSFLNNGISCRWCVKLKSFWWDLLFVERNICVLQAHAFTRRRDLIEIFTQLRNVIMMGKWIKEFLYIDRWMWWKCWCGLIWNV